MWTEHTQKTWMLAHTLTSKLRACSCSLAYQYHIPGPAYNWHLQALLDAASPLWWSSWHMRWDMTSVSGILPQ